ncbi:MAG: hypothetical protein ACOYM9_07230 [Bradymonadia bacterium]
MKADARRLLAFDAAAGALAGTALFALREPIVAWTGLPDPVLDFTGGANLAYALYAGTLTACAALGRPPGRAAMRALVFANGAWTVPCAVLAFATAPTANALGTAALVAEGVFVGVLALVEARVLLRRG